MKDTEIAALPAGTKLLHVPTALGAVVVIFNLQGVTDLNLDADNVAGIFLGKIKKWNDPAIAANNGGEEKPDKENTRQQPSLSGRNTKTPGTFFPSNTPPRDTAAGPGEGVPR